MDGRFEGAVGGRPAVMGVNGGVVTGAVGGSPLEGSVTGDEVLARTTDGVTVRGKLEGGRFTGTAVKGSVSRSVLLSNRVRTIGGRSVATGGNPSPTAAAAARTGALVRVQPPSADDLPPGLVDTAPEGVMAHIKDAIANNPGKAAAVVTVIAVGSKLLRLW